MSKSKKHKKKRTGGKDRLNGKSVKSNGVTGDEHEEQIHPENEEQEEEPDTPLSSTEFSSELREPAPADLLFTNGDAVLNGTSNLPSKRTKQLASDEAVDTEVSPHSQFHTSTPAEQELNISDVLQENASAVSEDTEARFEALAQEREALRDEVAQLRKSLEELRGKHEDELVDVNARLQETQGEKDHAETQYRNLLGKVNTIKSQLGERLKADAVCSQDKPWYNLDANLVIGRTFTSQRKDRGARRAVWGFTRPK